jgi:hypothetical protein
MTHQIALERPHPTPAGFRPARAAHPLASMTSEILATAGQASPGARGSGADQTSAPAAKVGPAGYAMAGRRPGFG